MFKGWGGTMHYKLVLLKDGVEGFVIGSNCFSVIIRSDLKPFLAEKLSILDAKLR